MRPEDLNALNDTAQKSFAEAVKLATDGRRRVPHEDAPHADGFLLPAAVANKMLEATEALQKLAKLRHGIGSAGSEER